MDFMPALPEFVMAIGAMTLLMIGVFRGNEITGNLSWLAVLLLLGTAVVVVTGGTQGEAFSGTIIVDGYGVFAKVLILIASATAIVLSMDYLKKEKMERFEFPVLIVLATLGMMLMVSANDLISLYMGIEMQSLSLYIVASFKRDSLRSTEAGLKYFVLGALSSGMLLYGSSLIYGFSGTTSFTGIAEMLSHGHAPIGLVIGMVFLMAGLAFKISAVPFHMWTPDVYEGAPTPITAFFAAAPKIAAITLFARVLVSAFGEITDQWQQVIVFISIASMVLGAFAAIGQNNIKRLMAYSSIANMGFALVGLAAGTEEGVRGLLIYMLIYMIMNAGVFVCILAMRRKEGAIENISDLAGLSRNQPLLAMCLAILMFSMAGIPPMAGFFGKFYVFLAAINSGLYTLAVIGVVASVVGAFYYLRIIKTMYFDDPAEEFEPIGRELKGVLLVSSVFTMFFFVYPIPFLNAATTAAAVLFP